MSTGLTFTELLDCPSSVRSEEAPRTLRANFGGGYSQRAGDGLNANLRKYSISWQNFSDADIATLRTGFRALEGYIAFDWTPPKDTLAGKFICPNWNTPISRPNASTMSATFVEVADL